MCCGKGLDKFQFFSRRTGFVLFSLIPYTCLSVAAGQPDSLSRQLEELEVTAPGRKIVNRNEWGDQTLDVRALSRYGRTLGEADPVKQIQMLPGVHVSDDYASGFSVEGASYSQSLVEIDSAPLFFPYHFGGIFSMINPSYFEKVVFRRFFPANASSARLGSSLSASSPLRHPDRPAGSLSLGMIASGVSMRVALDRRLSLSLAGRISYFDLLYGPILKDEENSYSYSLGDLNASLLFTPCAADEFVLSIHGNRDRLRYSHGAVENDLGLNWANSVASLRWNHESDSWKSSFGLWYSALDTELHLSLGVSDARSQSGVSQCGFRGQFDFTLSGRDRLSAGLIAGGTRFSIPSVTSDWAGINSTDASRVNSIESKVYASSVHDISESVSLKSELAFYLYSSQGQHVFFPSPSVSSLFTTEYGDFRVGLAYRPQFMHQVGLSEIGLASNFWIGSGRRVHESSVLTGNVEWNMPFGEGDWEIGCNLYGSMVRNEAFYSGSVFDMLAGDFDPVDKITPVNGFNTGADISFGRVRGPLTGWLAYSFGIARRRYPDFPGRWLPSSNEVLSSLKCFVAWKLDDHWEFGATFNYSAGRPYTPVVEAYLLGGNVVMTYGVRNSVRLPDYHRLDLSTTYSFETGGRIPLRHSLNFSLLNAYGHLNAEFVTYGYSSVRNEIYRKTSGSLFRFLPSLSYVIEYR